ncbi:amidotransferase GatB/YqeY subunit [Ameyamaea chiangmaiensis NBRC 103196]|uniref:GatB/YqeY domain-containing protein n=1 Tax=Ameyamaea chiangmaiensis TaxID=442969 RepID=A0A850P947_9PROT|nr:GatB/YqeY domain-containing protein [Ameyamaea chiangmaiensis]MBS4075390.1 GatB/YqeY domain-containing protein [Ameyamaea chiangmaiensis]NVN41135.1 GatB/YqeY domain-containing protein [Ameyamaea chiangmaiensis]GBQ69924.1 amidotransferase GatB/YqeY subunit [Ameyamaea chiangmaiensis NBRC 103196]
MSLRARLMDDLKTAMKAGESAKVATIRMITAKLKDADIAARSKGVDTIGDDEAVGVLRGMVKSRIESATLYRQGDRLELADKEEAEIALIKTYLPPELDEAALEAAVAEAIAQTEAVSMKDMGKVMGALKVRFGATLDLGRANGLVKARLS